MKKGGKLIALSITFLGAFGLYLYLRRTKTEQEVENWSNSVPWLTAHAKGEGDWQVHPEKAAWWWDSGYAKELSQKRLLTT